MGETGIDRHSVAHHSAFGGQGDREDHVLAAPLQVFDFEAEVAALRAERPFREHDRNAKTLVKSNAFRLVLGVMRAGAAFDEDAPRGHVSLLVREGRVALQVGAERAEVGPGQVAAIGADLPWQGRAEQDSVILFHFSWPD